MVMSPMHHGLHNLILHQDFCIQSVTLRNDIDIAVRVDALSKLGNMDQKAAVSLDLIRVVRLEQSSLCRPYI